MQYIETLRKNSALQSASLQLYTNIWLVMRVAPDAISMLPYEPKDDITHVLILRLPLTFSYVL